MKFYKLILPGAVGAFAAGALLAGAASAATINVTVTNEQGPGGLFFTPFVAVFHDGSFDSFDSGDMANGELEALAEQGDFSGVKGLADGADHVTGVFINSDGFGGAPVLDPGETSSLSFDLDVSDNRYFSFLSMIIPSNDLFVGNDNATAYELFNDVGLFTNIGVINIYSSNVWDAGTEANNNLGAAFNANNPTASLDQTNNIGLVGGLSFLNGESTVAGTSIFGQSADRNLIASIQITAGPEVSTVPLPAGLPLLLAGIGGFGLLRRKRKNT